MSNSVRPQRQQPTRLSRPWDSPGKNTGVGCHFLLQCMKVKSESESEVVSDSSRPHGLQPTRLLHPWDFPGKSTGVGCHHLLRTHDRHTKNFIIFLFLPEEQIQSSRLIWNIKGIYCLILNIPERWKLLVIILKLHGILVLPCWSSG